MTDVHICPTLVKGEKVFLITPVSPVISGMGILIEMINLGNLIKFLC